MLIRRRKGWKIAESEVTPEHVFFKRRDVLKAAAILPGVAALGIGSSIGEPIDDPSRALYPAKRNDKLLLDREVTPERTNAHYNNFYEFGSGKDSGGGRIAQNPAVDLENRRLGRKSARNRDRRSHRRDTTRGTALPSPLCRRLGDGGALDGFSLGGVA